MSPETLRSSTLPAMIPASYIFTTMLWDASRDADEQIRYLCGRLYGLAAEPMYNYYQTLENGAAVYFATDYINDLSRFLLPIAPECRRHLDAAKAAAQNDAGEVLQRIQHECDLFQYSFEAAQGWIPAATLTIPEAVRQANKIGNGSFEMTEYEMAHWWNNTMRGQFEFSMVHEEAFQGERSALIKTIQPGWGRFYQRIENLDPQKRYVVSAVVKTTNAAGLGGNIWLGNGTANVTFHSFGATAGQWMRFTIFNYPVPKGNMDIYLTSLGNTGNIYWDDVISCEEDIWKAHISLP